MLHIITQQGNGNEKPMVNFKMSDNNKCCQGCEGIRTFTSHAADRNMKCYNTLEESGNSSKRQTVI